MTGDRTKAKLILHDQLARLWSDPRFVDGRDSGTALREFINAWLWARFEHGADRDPMWAALRDRIPGSRNQHYLWGIYAADAPRYQPPFEYGCVVPKTRGPNAGKPCNRSGSTFRVTDPATGEWRMATFCKHHTLEADAARAAEKALVNVPEPLPNVGGLLPSYIKARNWPDMYARARHGWKPPYVGIVADDWPVMAKAVKAPVVKAGLTVLDGGGERLGPVHRQEPPALRLVGDA